MTKLDRDYRASTGLLIGSSDAALRLLSLIDRLGVSDVPVLLQGESGTGKELVAKRIFGVRPAGRFVTIDCASLPSNLIESELFGHERGAFSGAIQARTGLLQLADGGTAFFDEIGELPIEVQSKLLRVLQEHEIRSVGSDTTRACSFRVIAATNRILEEEVKQGKFRLDLYYRLNVITIALPPLRERKRDIPDLAAHFLHKWRKDLEISPEMAEALQNHHWPGNIRELENCIARLVALADGALSVDDLPFRLSSQVHTPNRQISAFDTQALAPGERTTGDRSVSAAERVAIEQAMAETDGRVGEAARRLGIGRTTLYRRLKQYERRSTRGGNAENRLIRAASGSGR